MMMAGQEGAQIKRASHSEGLGQRLGNAQEMALRLENGLRDLADSLLGDVPKAPGEANTLREVESRPCAGAVGELFERAENIEDRLQSSLRELDRLKRLV